ncbi:hypothetical protein [Agromyces lapidis]|uniref:DUF349 domain-containing protein n=1 Tax=Agromyces lapidis TaxID=279574 RepID=A0ABV5SLM2_9MICO|nr:hypothetical protein [Agromyces lapidis]
MRSDAAVDAGEARRRVGEAGAVSDEVWLGAAKERFSARASEIGPELRHLADGWSEQAKVLAVFADELEALRARQASLDRERLNTDEELATLFAELATVSRDEALMMKDPLLFADWDRNRDDVQWRIDRAEARQAQLTANWNRLVADREDLDRRTVAALQSREIVGGMWGFGAAASSPSGRALRSNGTDVRSRACDPLREPPRTARRS